MVTTAGPPVLRGFGSFLLSTTTSGLMALGRLTYLLPADNSGSRSFLSRLLASHFANGGVNRLRLVTSVLLGSLLYHTLLQTSNFTDGCSPSLYFRLVGSSSQGSVDCCSSCGKGGLWPVCPGRRSDLGSDLLVVPDTLNTHSSIFCWGRGTRTQQEI